MLPAAKIRKLHFFGDKIASQAAGANFQGYRGTAHLGLYLFKVGFPGTAGMVLGMTYRIAADGVLSANIAGP
jgi:hypothetical protein